MGSTNILHKRSNAFVYVPSDIVDTSIHQIKLKQFFNLINTCELKITQGSDFPDNLLWRQYDFFFIDMFGREVSYKIPSDVLQLAHHHKVIFFNINHDKLDEKHCLMSGIDGVFYCEDRPDIILKGIENIKNSGLWYKRDTMGRALVSFLNTFKTRKNNAMAWQEDNMRSDPLKAMLTKREQMIIKLVSKGAKNKEIADQLHISPNTVKTHIYSIFRKTSSRNRIELMAWSQQFVNL